MKKQFLFALLALAALLLPASAGLSTYSSGNVNGGGTSLGLAIPDGEDPIGLSSDIIVSGAGSPVAFVTVTLNVSGGYNGDLYAYLSYNGALVTLLNHVGTDAGGTFQSAAGFSTAGFNNITLADGGTGGNIHGIETPISGISYGADGGSLSAFNGMNPNGTWTLFLADNASPNQSTLEGWSLDITPVPEPANAAMAIFGIVAMGVAATRWYLNSVAAKRPRS